MTIRSPLSHLFVVAVLMVGLGLCTPVAAQHARPAFKVLPAAEAVTLYWADALNQFKGVRAAAPHDTDATGLLASSRHDLLVVPQGAAVWDEFGEHPLVTVKAGRNDLRAGQPQVDMGVVWRAPNRAAAEKLFNELKAVVLALPGAQPRGDQERFWVSVGVKARPNRRVLTLQLPEEPDDPETGSYGIGLDVSFNLDDPTWDGGQGPPA